MPHFFSRSLRFQPGDFPRRCHRQQCQDILQRRATTGREVRQRLSAGVPQGRRPGTRADVQKPQARFQFPVSNTFIQMNFSSNYIQFMNIRFFYYVQYIQYISKLTA